jgi:hypothetical protein
MLIIEPLVRKIKQNEKRILRVFMIIERQIVPAYTGGEQVHQLL